MKLKNKGFTLIELMIVVVILGVLMSTVLPKLTGAQARARDTGRIADLGNISAALTTYYDDNGQFPGVDATTECLIETGGSGQDISIYLEGSKVPKDPQINANTYLCNGTNKGRYWYAPMTKDGIAKNSFVLCADMETFQKANTDVTDGSVNVAQQAATGNTIGTIGSAGGAATYITMAADIGNDVAAELTNAGQSQYCLLRP
jgi:general secretion pathway protein G